VEGVASLSQGRTAAAQCGLFTYKSVPVIFEPPCKFKTDIPSSQKSSPFRLSWTCSVLMFLPYRWPSF